MTALEDLSCLVVEDEALIALNLCDIIEDLGGRVAARVGRLEEGLELARTHAIDLAFLDINLGGPRSFPIADILRQRGIPFVFTTGYGAEAVALGYDAPLVFKPYDEMTIAAGAERALENAAPQP